MPLYEYLCAKCRKRFEKIEKHSARRTQKCPHCGGRAERQFSSPAIQFKGSGWYVTDYGRKPAPAESKSGDAAATGEAKETSEAKESKEAKDTKEKKPPAKESKKK